MFFKKRKRVSIKGEKIKPYLGVTRKLLVIIFFATFILSLFILLFSKKITTAGVSFIFIFLLLYMYFFTKIRLKESNKIRNMESVFPDFLQLMSSNLRAGMTTDRALLMSARKEFNPLDKEIIKLGKDIVTGREIEESLLKMAERINSDKISKTIRIIVSGIRSGGNIATLLEETAVNMRERGFVEKRAASNVLMYLIFIFVATAFGAPALFGLSSVLVEILTKILSTIPAVQTNVNLPFTLTSVSISTTFITYYALVFLVVTDILGALVLGLVSKGEEKTGLKYAVPLIIMSIFVFFLVRILLLSYFSNIF